MALKTRLAGGILLVLGMNNLLATTQQEILVDKVIARVDNQFVLQSELERECNAYQAQDGKKVSNLPCKILEGLLINKMLLARAAIEGINIAKEEIAYYLDKRMEELLNQAGSTMRLEQYTGKSIEIFKEELRKAIETQHTIDKMRKKIVQNISITPKEVKEFFQALPTNELPYYSTEVEVRQIVRYPMMSQQAKKAIIERLVALKERIQAGESFEELAKQYSEDLGSANNGGEVGFWRVGELEPAYETAALTLKPGSITVPIETSYGFHLIQLIKRQKDKYNTRHILIKFSDSKLDLEAAKIHLDSIRRDIVEGKTNFEKAAIEHSQAPSTAQQGGLLYSSDQGLRIPIEALPADVLALVENLIPGAISETVAFTTAMGKQALRILYLKDKRPAHQANLTQDYDKIYQLALTAKKVQALNKWFQVVKTEAIIIVDPAYASCGSF